MMQNFCNPNSQTNMLAHDWSIYPSTILQFPSQLVLSPFQGGLQQVNEMPDFFQFFPYFSQQPLQVNSIQAESLGPQEQKSSNRKMREKRRRNANKQVESAKKNGESNMVNHFFSFYNSRERSEKSLESFLGTFQKNEEKREKIIHLFYNSIQALNVRRGKKYVNRNIFKKLLNPHKFEEQMVQVREKIEKIKDVSIGELCEVFRKAIFSFYRTLSISFTLTSRRISGQEIKNIHFKKRRDILELVSSFGSSDP